MEFIGMDTSNIIYVENNVRASEIERPLRFTFDRKLDGKGGFRFVYEQGEIKCSHPVDVYADLCRMAPGEMNALAKPLHSFVYMDVGKWQDKEYSFGLVSGADVYLCEYLPYECQPYSQFAKNESVNSFLFHMGLKGCYINVINYARAPNVTSETKKDKDIYLILPDYHLPPVSWFYTNFMSNTESQFEILSNQETGLPDWFCRTAAHLRNPELYGRWGAMKKKNLLVNVRVENANREIFQKAGVHLVTFLNTVAQLNEPLKSQIRFINVGDMFELWLGRDKFQFIQGDKLKPEFIPGGENKAADWAAEVMVQNMEVIEAHRAIDKAVKESVYIWGNHESYLMYDSVTKQIGIPSRVPLYQGLNGDLHIEHGQRFDSHNIDNVSKDDGPRKANWVYMVPIIRETEGFFRGGEALIDGITERDSYFVGASLIYLSQQFHKGAANASVKKPFSIFCMGHTHSRQLNIFNISAKYSLYGNVP